MSTKRVLETQEKLMANWPGTPLDRAGIVRILNTEGTKPPLLWIFNSAKEPQLLADALGPDQPLIFSRSAHLLVSPEDDRLFIRKLLGDYLLDEISRSFGGQKFDAGTSCQGASLVMYLADKSDRKTFEIGSMCLINSRLPQIATGCPALLIYGSGDPGHDPFRENMEEAAAKASVCYSEYERILLDAQHGGYYSEEILANILSQFQSFRSERSAKGWAGRLQVLRQWAGTLRSKGAA
ncbi:hypothetical protein [Shimia sp. Alg240-R146]|uniref:hypothetical protein n=1 Tax=Shimia sp. Alg240-R146 TaxID=2993449 RepID=UPI0022E48D30|nr:hypothetical protein [Shimia sp. Alg240-R146]